ncbi:hypothetical protein EC957_005931 [Mortierella hygrophila]|uniref:F-box domain-containing protein n=1 Tax=Mortierella hygrophila TaxID=979708 RepID=A0A9P6K621_9FUNG|nr:hypothetical protein EC957_005931 [Mortierella hygrophila]
MPPSHPLDIPEILTRIGLFLPLWVDNNNTFRPTSEQHTRFEPHTFLTCASVSKTWRQAFLPLLWHRYDCIVMRFVPQETVAINSPHFRVLQIFGNDATNFQCVDLIDLTIRGAPNQMLLGILVATRSSRIGAGARAGCEGGLIALSPQQQLVRSNLYLQSLFWHGPSPLKSLDVNDFSGLKYIQTLKLSNWLCSPKTMVELLSLVLGTLREFKLDRISGLQPLLSEDLNAFTERLSTLFTPQPDKDRETNNNNNNNNSNNKLILSRLTTLVSTCDKAVSLFLAELVKCSPRLKSLDVYLADDNGTTRLADNLNTQCPEFQELKLSPVVTFRRVDALIRKSSAVGLRKLSIEVCGPDEHLVAAILQHAGTMEDLAIERSVGDMDICRYFALLEECPNLESFSLSATAVTLDKEFLDTLRKKGSGGGGDGVGSSGHGWKCRRRLRKLALNPRLYLGGGRDSGGGNGGEQLKADKDLLKVMSNSVSVMGWYRPRHLDPQQHFRGSFINHTMVRKTFELVLGLEKLETLVLDTVVFRSSRTAGPVQLD